MTQAAQRIIEVIYREGVNQTSMAIALGLSPQGLHYKLNKSLTLDTEFEQACYDYFHKQGIKTVKKSDECMAANDLYLEFTSITNQHLSILANEIREAIKNGNIDDGERVRLIDKIKSMRTDISSAIDELEELLK